MDVEYWKVVDCECLGMLLPMLADAAAAVVVFIAFLFLGGRRGCFSSSEEGCTKVATRERVCRSFVYELFLNSIIPPLLSRSWNPKKTPYKRILFAMSACDIIASTNFGWQNFLVPEETSQRVWAFGNDASCTATGTLTQFSFSSYGTTTC